MLGTSIIFTMQSTIKLLLPTYVIQTGYVNIVNTDYIVLLLFMREANDKSKPKLIIYTDKIRSLIVI